MPNSEGNGSKTSDKYESPAKTWFQGTADVRMHVGKVNDVCKLF